MTPLITAAVRLLLSGVRKGSGSGSGRPEKSAWEKHNEWNKKDLASGGHARRIREAAGKTPRYSPTTENFLKRFSPR